MRIVTINSNPNDASRTDELSTPATAYPPAAEPALPSRHVAGLRAMWTPSG